MDAATYTFIENILMLTTMGLTLLAVWTACWMVKQKAVFVYQRQLLIWRLKK